MVDTSTLCVSLFPGNSKVANGDTYRIQGNTVRAENGIVKFTGLRVHGRPGDTVNVTFRSETGLIVVQRQLVLSRCQSGQFTDRSGTSSTQESFACGACPSPLFSLYPSSSHCQQCASLAANSWAVCNGPALVPANGFYQSHPRSLLVSPSMRLKIIVLRVRQGRQ
jgi:hypothetical protein